MATSTKIRLFSRLLDRCESPFWVIGPDDRLVFLSAAVGQWLSIDPELLIGRKCLAGASITDDPLDFLAASLAAPPGFLKQGTASLVVQPAMPDSRSGRPLQLDTRFVRLDDGDQTLTLAMTGKFDDETTDTEIESAVSLRQQLDSWRQHHERSAVAITIGSSRSAKRTSYQIQVAGSTRTDVLVVSPPGCFAESIAHSIHRKSAPGEVVATIDGPLMDSELLDASLSAPLAHLAGSDSATATAIIKAVDETPLEAQQRMTQHLAHFGNRLRLIAIAGAVSPESDELVAEGDIGGIDSDLLDRLCGIHVQIDPLAERVEDLQLMATAFLDRRRAAGDTSADRFSRPALDALVIYPWPGNYEELDQAVRHASRACRGETLAPQDLPLAVRSYRPSAGSVEGLPQIDLDQAVAKFEQQVITGTLEAVNGNRAEAARRLNISRARLLRKLEAFEESAS